MSKFRHLQHIDKSVGEVAINLDHVIRIIPTEADGRLGDSPARTVERS